MRNGAIIAFGGACLVGATVLIGFGIHAYGQITGRFDYAFPPEMIELFKWTLCTLGGVGVTGTVASVIATYRGRKNGGGS